MKFSKNAILKTVYDNAWRREPDWNRRKEAGRIARRAVRDLLIKLGDLK